VLVAARAVPVEYVELCIVSVLVLVAGTMTVEKVELGVKLCVVAEEEMEATITDELEDETATSVEVEDELTSAAEVLTVTDDVDASTVDDCSTADEVAGVELDATAADDTEPEDDAPPGPDTLVVRSPLSTYTPLK